MKLVKRAMGVFVLALASLLVAQPIFAQDNMVDTIKKRGRLQVGFSSFLPWAIQIGRAHV